MLSALAMMRSPISIAIANRYVRENRLTISSPSPSPLASAVRSQISWTAAMSGNVKNATHSMANPNLAPVCAYVAVPEGSSSDAPVTRPGPRDFRYVRHPIGCLSDLFRPRRRDEPDEPFFALGDRVRTQPCELSCVSHGQ